MDIYIVRHGETDYNLKHDRWGGRVDVPLNQTGINEALKLKEDIKGINFSKVYSSPLIRALETAEILTDKDIIIDNRLIERSNGELEGKLKSETPKDIRFNDPEENRFGIENVKLVEKRVDDFFDEVIDEESDEKILLVTHAGVGMYLIAYFEGKPKNKDYSKYKLNNCEIKEFKKVKKRVKKS